jgi:sugar lactone lactonase YvrE
MTVSDGQDAPGDLRLELAGGPFNLNVQLQNAGGTVRATVSANCSQPTGTHAVSVRVRNSANLTDVDDFNVIVQEDPAPTLGTYTNLTVVAGLSGLVTPSAAPADANGNLVSVTVAPTSLSGGTQVRINQTTGRVTVDAGANAPAATHEITVTARDRCNKSAKQTFLLTIARTPPAIASLRTYPVTTQGGTSAPLDVATVSDLQDAAGTLRVSGVNVPGIAVTATNTNGTVSVRATAGCTVGAGTYRAGVEVKDSDNMVTTMPLDVAVNLNPPPVLGTYLDTGVTVGSTVVIYPSASPTDPNNTVSLSVTPPILQGGGLVWVNPNGQVTVQTFSNFTTPGITYPVQVTATDSCGAAATRTFKLTIRPLACPTERSTLLAADTGNDRIQRSNGVAWNVVGSMIGGNGLGQFRTPEAVVASADLRTIYVADTGNRRIQWSRDGGATWAVFASGLTPNGLVLDRDGHLYVSEAGENRVSRYHGGVPGSPVALATAGNGAGQVDNPNGLAIDCRMTLYIADTGNDRILSVLTADAAMLPNTGTVVASAGAGLNPPQVLAPQGVGVNNAGTLFVADTGNDRVLQFAANLASAAALCTAGAALGQVQDPEGVTISAFGVGALGGGPSVIVSDTGNDRIEGIRMPVAAGTWLLVPPPLGGGPGGAVGQFKDPSKVR